MAANSINSRWLHCGGVRRLVVLPESQRPSETIAECEAAVGGACTGALRSHAQPALCIEGADIPLRQILDEVSEGRNDIAKSPSDCTRALTWNGRGRSNPRGNG